MDNAEFERRLARRKALFWDRAREMIRRRSQFPIPEPFPEEATMNRVVPSHTWAKCESHPNDGNHECMIGELTCVYCGVPLHQARCNGCERFLSIAEMHEGETRCENCR